MSEPSTTDTSRALPWALFVSAFLALCVTAGFNPITGDATQTCNAAENLIDRGEPQVSGPARIDITRGPDGKSYAKYPLMTVLCCAPTVLLGRAGAWLGGSGSPLERYFLGLAPALYAALGTLGFFLLARQLGFRERFAVLAALLLLFTTPVWHYARSMYSENPQVVVVIWSTWLWLRARGRASAKAMLMGGFLLGLAINLKSLLVILPVAVLLDRMFDPWDKRTWGRFLGFTGLGSAPGLAGFFWYNHLRYGQLLATGYTTGRDGSLGFDGSLWSGLYGLLFSSGKSIFLYAPLLVLMGAGLARMWSTRKRDFVLLGLPVAFVFLAAAKWWCWSGDVAWGPRLVVPVMPLLFVPVLFALEGARALRRTLAVGLAAAGLYVGVLGAAVRPFSYISVAQASAERTLGKMREQDNVRDDLILLHFVPELSPIVGHHWLLMRYLKHESWTEQSYYPWRSTNLSAWRVRKDPVPDHLNFWFTRGPNYAALIANALGLVAAVTWLVVSLRRRWQAL